MKEIRKIIQTYETFKGQNMKMALASVVEVQESSYRRVGARMLVCENGNWEGGISGGCLEGDALIKAKKAIGSNKPSITIYNTLEEDDHQIGVGLGCNGLIKVFFQPLDTEDLDNEIELLKKVIADKKAAIMVKVIRSDDPSVLGELKLIQQEDKVRSFHGLEEKDFVQILKEVKRKRKPQIVSTNTANKGKADVLIEYLRPETKLIIIGDNYDVLSMIAVADNLGWEIHLVGRKRKMSKTIFSKCKTVYEYEEVEQIPIDDFTAVVFMTHDYQWDKKLLPLILKQNTRYVGMLGPRKRNLKLIEETEIKLYDIPTFFGPVGLDIGAETPEEIAISVASEIVSVFRERNGSFLRDRNTTIHQRGNQVLE